MERHIENTINELKEKINLNANLSYFSIQNKEHDEAIFCSKIDNIEVAVKIVELINKKLNLPEIEKSLIFARFYYEILADEILPLDNLFLNYFEF